MGDAGPDATISSDSERVLAGVLARLADHVDRFVPLWGGCFPPRSFEGAVLLELLSLCRVLRWNGVDDLRTRGPFDLALPGRAHGPIPGFSRVLRGAPRCSCADGGRAPYSRVRAGLFPGRRSTGSTPFPSPGEGEECQERC